jgi:hypothetical protein
MEAAYCILPKTLFAISFSSGLNFQAQQCILLTYEMFSFKFYVSGQHSIVLAIVNLGLYILYMNAFICAIVWHPLPNRICHA